MKGWFLLAKADWKQGHLSVGLRNLEDGLRHLPGNSELVALKAEITAEIDTFLRGSERVPRICKMPSRRADSRHASPCPSPSPVSSGRSSRATLHPSRSPSPGPCDFPMHGISGREAHSRASFCGTPKLGIRRPSLGSWRPPRTPDPNRDTSP